MLVAMCPITRRHTQEDRNLYNYFGKILKSHVSLEFSTLFLFLIFFIEIKAERGSVVG
jgi:hypothetical protein